MAETATLFGRKRGHDFLEPRIVPERIPVWHEDQSFVIPSGGAVFAESECIERVSSLTRDRVSPANAGKQFPERVERAVHGEDHAFLVFGANAARE